MTFLKPDRTVKTVYIHCSASDRPEHDDVSVIRSWHMAKGWNDVGYHFFIKKNGQVQPGRDLEKVPAAQEGHNTGSIAICCHGLEKAKFTDQQYAALYNLCHEINEAYEGSVTFHGHCEVSPKSCPVFDYKNILQLDSHGYMGKGGLPLISHERFLSLPMDLPTLGVGATSMAVAVVQTMLEMREVDGIFGRDTAAAVEQFQRRIGLPPDGIVNRATWDALASQ